MTATDPAFLAAYKTFDEAGARYKACPRWRLVRRRRLSQEWDRAAAQALPILDRPEIPSTEGGNDDRTADR